MATKQQVGSRAQKEALQRFKAGKLTRGQQIGIWNELGKLQPEAADHVIAHPDLYHNRILSMARRARTDRAIVSVGIRTINDLEGVLLACENRARISITMKPLSTGRIGSITTMPGLTVVGEYDLGLLKAACEGKWGSTPRTFEAEIVLGPWARIFRAADIFWGAVERVEIFEVLEVRGMTYPEPHRISDDVQALLAEHSQIFYNEEIFRRACREANLSLQAERATELAPDASMEDALYIFIHNGPRMTFLKHYCELFYAAIGT